MSIGERFGLTAIVLGFVAFPLLMFAIEAPTRKSERTTKFWGSVMAVLAVLCGLTAIWIGAFV